MLVVMAENKASPSIRNSAGLSTGNTIGSLSFSQGKVDTIMLSVYVPLRTVILM